MRGKGQVLLIVEALHDIVEALHNFVIHVHKIAGETTAPTCSTTDRLHRQLLCHKEQILLEAGNNPYAISQPRKRPVETPRDLYSVRPLRHQTKTSSWGRTAPASKSFCGEYRRSGPTESAKQRPLSIGGYWPGRASAGTGVAPGCFVVFLKKEEREQEELKESVLHLLPFQEKTPGVYVNWKTEWSWHQQLLRDSSKHKSMQFLIQGVVIVFCIV